MYKLTRSNHFRQRYKKFTKKNSQLKVSIVKTLYKLEENPFNPSLRTHQVIPKSGKPALSSRVNGDIRIIWEFNKQAINIIFLLDLGGHSGKYRVYK